MRRSLRCWLLLALLAQLLAACSFNDDAAPTQVPSTTPGTTERPQAGGGGEFIMALAGEVPAYDPALVADVTSAFLARQLFGGLVTLSNELTAEPDLAERWDLEDDGVTYTFHLRDGISFADGTPITADDIKWSMERALSPELGPSPPGSTYLIDIAGAAEKLAGEADEVSGIEVVDERTVRITLAAPNGAFLLKLTNPPAFVVDRRTVEDGGDDWTDAPNGSGPFVLYDSTDEALLLRPNLRYHLSPAKLDQLRLLIGAAASNEMLLYEEGEVDYAEVPSSDLARVSDESNPLSQELITVPGLTLSYIGMNVEMEPFDDPKVRQAFSLLIDRSKLAEVSFSGAAEPAAGILPPTMPGADEGLSVPEVDAERARQLLRESRYGGAENLPPIVGYSTGGGVGLLAGLAQETLGISMEVRGVESFGSYLRGLDERRYALFDLSWIADYPDPENFLGVLFGSASGSNHTGYSNPEVDALLAEAGAESDEQRRFELYQEAEQIILEDAPAIPLNHSVENVLIKPYVKGLVVTPQGLVDLTSVELTK